MSKLEELINELCPDGVEYVKLKEVAQISAGGDLPENYTKGQKVPSEQYPYPIYSNGTADGALYGFTDSYKIEKEAVTISARGTIGCHAVRAGKFTPIVRLITMIADESKITTKFLHYALDVAGIEGVTTGIPSLTVPMLEKFKIPLPPLPVQREIVRILDNFTELTAELTARKKQYEYYRNELLTFDETVNLVTLDYICDITRGRVMSKDYLRENAGAYPVYSSQTANSGIFGYIDSYDYEDESITWTTDGANAGSVFYHDNEKFSITNVCGLLRVINKEETNTRYVYYVLQVVAKRYVSSGMGNPKLMSNAMARIQIPLPVLEIQNRIVAILDRFDTLCNDLTSGLPAEIEARKKQYEYYRDKLLTFKEAKA